MKKKIVGTILAVFMPALIFAATQYFPDIVVKGSPWYDIRGYTSLSAAVTAVGASGKTMLILGNVPVAASTDVSAIPLWFLGSGKFTVAAGQALTVGSISAGTHTIFAGAGTVVPVEYSVKAEWFGSLTNAITMLAAAECAVEIGSNQAISATNSSPATMTLSFVGPGRLTIATGQTFTANGFVHTRNNKCIIYGNGVFVPLAEQDVNSFWWPSFARTIADLGTNTRTVLVSTNQVVSGNLTVPANISTVVKLGGMISPAGAVTVTFVGSFDAGLYSCIGGAGIVNPGATKDAYVQWWGVVSYANAADAYAAGLAVASTNADAIIRAIAGVADGRLRWPKGTYPCNKELIVRYAQAWVGDGRGNVLTPWATENTPVTQLLLVGDGSAYKTIKTRVLYRDEITDAQDAPLSAGVNVQHQGFSLKDIVITCYWDPTLILQNPTTYSAEYVIANPTEFITLAGGQKIYLGANWDVGVFHNRMHVKIKDAAVIGGFRMASVYADASRAVAAGYLPGTGWDGIAYPQDSDEVSGSDGMAISNLITWGGRWGLKVQGAEPKTGLKTYGKDYILALDVVFASAPVEGNTITLGEVTFTFKDDPATTTEVGTRPTTTESVIMLANAAEDYYADEANNYPLFNSGLYFADGATLRIFSRGTTLTETTYFQTSYTAATNAPAVMVLSGANPSVTADPAQYYEQGVGLLADSRGGYGFSDLSIEHSQLFGPGHPSGWAPWPMRADKDHTIFATDDGQGGSYSISGLAGNANRMLQGHRYHDVRFDSNTAAFNAKLGRTNKDDFTSCHYDNASVPYSTEAVPVVPDRGSYDIDDYKYGSVTRIARTTRRTRFFALDSIPKAAYFSYDDAGSGSLLDVSGRGTFTGNVTVYRGNISIDQSDTINGAAKLKLLSGASGASGIDFRDPTGIRFAFRYYPSSGNFRLLEDGDQLASFSRSGNNAEFEMQPLSTGQSIVKSNPGALSLRGDDDACFDLRSGSISVARGCNHTGTAQAGGASTITLATTAPGYTDLIGLTITTTGGTGTGQTRTISGYNTTTKVATVSTAWGVQPDNTTTYSVERYFRVYGKLRATTTLFSNSSATAETETGTPASAVDAVSTAGINVLTYGADPTGATDSLAAFNAAVAAAETTRQRMIYVPAGEYSLSAAVASSAIMWRGDGTQSKLVWDQGTDGIVFTPVGVEQTAGVADMALYAKDVNGLTAIKCPKNSADYFTRRSKFQFDRVLIAGWTKPAAPIGFETVEAWTIGIDIGDAWQVGISNVDMYGNYRLDTDPTTQFQCVGIKFDANATMLTARVFGITLASLYRAIEIARRCFFTITDFDIAHSYDGIVQTASAAYTFGESRVSTGNINCQRYGIYFFGDAGVDTIGGTVDDVVRASRSITDVIVRRHSEGWKGGPADPWYGFRFDYWSHMPISGCMAQPDETNGAFPGTQYGLYLLHCGSASVVNFLAGATLDVGIYLHGVTGSTFINTQTWQGNGTGDAIFSLEDNTRSCTFGPLAFMSSAFTGTPFVFDASIGSTNVFPEQFPRPWTAPNAMVQPINPVTDYADHTYSTTGVERGTAGENFARGHLLYLKKTGGVMKWFKYDADDATIKTFDPGGMALESLVADAVGAILVRGTMRDDTWSVTATNDTADLSIYPSSTLGGISKTPIAAGAGNVITKIGTITADNTVRFNFDTKREVIP